MDPDACWTRIVQAIAEGRDAETMMLEVPDAPEFRTMADASRLEAIEALMDLAGWLRRRGDVLFMVPDGNATTFPRNVEVTS